MTGILKVDQWKDSGDNTLMTSDGAGNLTVNAPFSSTGIDDNATSTAITIDSSQRVGITEQINKTVNNSQLIIAGGNDSNQGGNILLYGPSASPANTIVYRQGTSEILRMDSEGLKIGGTGSANALDDYEEGTFSPTYLGSTTNPSVTYDTTVRYGAYTKIGRIVYFNLVNRTDAVSSSGSGDLRVGGLPFNADNTAFSSISRYGCNIGGFTGFSTSGSNMTGYIINDYIELFETQGASTVSTSELVNSANRNEIQITGFYVTSS